MPLCQEWCWLGRDVGALVRCSCPSRVVVVRFYEQKGGVVLSWHLVVARWSTISQSKQPVWMASLPSSFGSECCRPTCGMCLFVCRGAISTGRRSIYWHWGWWTELDGRSAGLDRWAESVPFLFGIPFVFGVPFVFGTAECLRLVSRHEPLCYGWFRR
jgi:hypothetical protein